MKARKALTTALLAFVTVSLAYLAVRSVRAAKQWQSPAAAMPVSSRRVADEPGKVIAYYFHVTVRCTTCRNIEAYSKEAIHKRFAKELASGRVEWRLVNVQLPENRHFIQDYELFTKSLVLVRMAGGREQEFKVLNDTWELAGDKAAMQDYVATEVHGFLRKLG